MKFRDMLFYSEEEREEIKPLPPAVFHIIIFGMFILLLNFLAVIYISKSEYIYFWDSATYWDIAKEICGGALKESPLAEIYNSIGNMNYNYVAGLLPAAVMSVFGTSRLVYILSLVDFYLVPSLILIYKLAKKLGKAPAVTAVIVILISPMLMFITLNGFADIGGAFGCLLCFYWYFERENKKENKELPLWRFFAIGTVLAAVMLWRRWFAFFSVSFITAMAADCILGKKKPYGVIITVLTSAAILLLCFKDFTVNILLADYGTLYSGYKFSASTDFKLITRYFGLIYILLLAVSSAAAMIRRREIQPVFMWIQIVVCVCMFMSTQTHGQQHLLLYAPSLIMLTIYVIRNITKEWMFILSVVMALAHTANVFVPYEQPQSISEIKIYAPIPNFSMLPRKRDDAYQILDLKRKLDKTVGEGETLGVLSSSFVLCEDALRNVEDSLGVKPERENYIVTLPQVDSRDLDFSAYGEVNYVLTVNPPQTHLAEGQQKVVENAVEDFNLWQGIALSYEEIYDFNMQIGDMDIKLYKRVREVPQHELISFEKRLKNS